MGAGLLNDPAGGFHERAGELWCEGVPLSRIGEEVGTPCYVYSDAVLRDRFARLSAAFRGVPHRVFYSVKANHNLEVLRVFRRLGAGADVVSGGELHRVRCAGFEGADVIFGGVGKTDDELTAGLDASVLLFNVESAGELRRLNALASARAVRAPVAIRVNPGVTADTHAYTQTGHYATKFGVAFEDAEALYAEAAALRALDPIGIDVHIGSQILSPEPYRAAIGRIGDLAARVRAQGIALRYLDVGGGFGVPSEGSVELDLAAVVEAIGSVSSKLELESMLEPGRWLVAPAGMLLARVVSVKRLGDRLYYVTDTGSNDFVRPSYYGAVHPIEPVRRGRAESVGDVVGPICETGDFLGRERALPALEDGDLLAVGYAGAYGFVMSSNYNSRPRAAEVIVRGDEYRIARRRETLADLVAAERVGEEDGES